MDSKLKPFECRASNMKGGTIYILTALFAANIAQPSTYTGLGWRGKRELELQELPKNVHVNKSKILHLNKTDLLQTRVLPFDTDEARPLPVSIEIKTGSTLWSDPGTPGVINFEVTNNRPIQTRFIFNVKDNDNYIRRVEPLSTTYVNPGSTTLVRVELESRQRNSGPDIVTLSAGWTGLSGSFESVTKNVYFYTGVQSTDSWKPDIWYYYRGDCYGAETPHNCHAKTWGADINFQDSGSGLLKIRSEPIGLTLNKEFIAGTREVVNGYYSATCCKTKVDIIAKDVLGNYRTLMIDVEKRWLSAGEISAIVLGVVLLLIILALIIFAIVRYCRRRQTMLTIYPRHRPTTTES